ncbi:MAG TPA: acyl-CoA carboxylase subunit beta [candidate division Zixibacteria bacterium]|nr:acyl-CoA carboxylase subunit beta [candidate division Zixibacteria bacterium]
MRSMEEKLQELNERRERIKQGGGLKLQEKQHAQGKMTARERIDYLLDPGTFVEFDLFARHIGTDYGLDRAEVPADGVVTGHGKINGRDVFVYSEDFTVIAGTFGERHGKKICKTVDLARKMGVPVIGINDSGGARVTEEMGALSEYGQLFFRHVRSSGVIPQIALIMGPVAGGQAYSPALMDFIFMVEKTSYMFIAGPPLVEAVVFKKTSNEELGGPAVHGRLSGVSDLTARDDRDCLDRTRELLGYLPPNCREQPPIEPPRDDPERRDEELLRLIPVDPRQAYDIHEVIHRVVDDGKFFELKKEFAPNLVIGFARLHGRPVGIVANNPKHLAGCLDVDASDKGSRFVRFCDAFNIPLLSLQDIPGFLIGNEMERKGIIRHGAKMLYAFAEATVPKITVVLRKAYAGGYLSMCSKDLGADFVFSLPTAEVCLMGPEGAVNILFRKEIAESADPDRTRAEKLAEFFERYVNPYYSAAHQHVDDIIDPREIRPRVIKALELCAGKVDELPGKKHGIMPV